MMAIITIHPLQFRRTIFHNIFMKIVFTVLYSRMVLVVVLVHYIPVYILYSAQLPPPHYSLFTVVLAHRSCCLNHSTTLKTLKKYPKLNQEKKKREKKTHAEKKKKNGGKTIAI